MLTVKLEVEKFQQTFTPPMTDVTTTAPAILDIWPYVEAVPAADLEAFTLGDVACVYQHPSGIYLHVLISTDDKTVFLVIVLDLINQLIYGHHLLNLTELYGLNDAE